MKRSTESVMGIICGGAHDPRDELQEGAAYIVVESCGVSHFSTQGTSAAGGPSDERSPWRCQNDMRDNGARGDNNSGPLEPADNLSHVLFQVEDFRLQVRRR